MSVKVFSSLIGLLDVNLASEQPFISASIFEAELAPLETFVRVQVEGVIGREAALDQRSIDLRECTGSIGYYTEAEPVSDITPGEPTTIESAQTSESEQLVEPQVTPSETKSLIESPTPESPTQETIEEVTEEGGGCLIATATYGSEMSSQVQLLREIRDNSLLMTSSGSAFMTGFNQFYYSFSPTIADWERQNPIFKEVVKVVITPLLTTLSILNYVDMDTDAKVLIFGIGLIGLNVGIYFVTPIILVSKLKKKFF